MFKNQLLYKYWQENKKKLLLLFALGWVASITTFLIPLSLGAFFDIHFQTQTNRGRLLSLIGLNLKTLNDFFLYFFLIIVLKILFDFIEKKSIASIADKYVSKLSGQLFSKQVQWPHETFNQKPYGHYLLRYSGDLNSIRNLLVRGLHGGIKDLLFLTSGLGILFLLNSSSTFLLLGLIIICFPLIYWMDTFQKPYIKEIDNRKSTLLSFVTRSFSRHTQIKEDHLETETINEFKKRTKRLLKFRQTYSVIESARQSLVPGIGYIIVGILLWKVSHDENKSISGGELLVYILVLMAVLPALRRLFKVSGIIQRGMISLQKKSVLLKKEDVAISISSPKDDTP